MVENLKSYIFSTNQDIIVFFKIFIVVNRKLYFNKIFELICFLNSINRITVWFT